MFHKLKEAIEALPDLIQDREGWGTLVINRRKPHTYRAFRMLDDTHRICLHRFDPCGPEDAFLHPHPWPGAFVVLQGEYRMQVGFSPDLESDPAIIMDTILAEGSCYSMESPLGWHSVQPIKTCWSIMVNGQPWATDVVHQAAPTTKGKDLDTMTPEQRNEHLANFMIPEFVLPECLWPDDVVRPA